MKKLLFYGIILTLLFNLVNASESFIRKDAGEAKALIKAFKISKAELLEVNINSTLQLPGEFYTMEVMQEIQADIMEELELKGEVKHIFNQEHYNPYYMVEEPVDEAIIYINKNQDTGYNQITVSAIDPEGKMTVVILYSAEIENQKESHIIIDIVQNKGYKDIGQVINQQQGVLTKIGSQIETTTTLVGTQEGQLSQLETKSWIDSIIKTLKAKKIEEVIDDRYTSTTLYTKEIPMVMEYDHKKVNLQLATRYSEYENKTYLWIATPLITNTY